MARHSRPGAMGVSHDSSKLGTMNRVRPPVRIRWGSALLGAVCGLFATMVISLTANILIALVDRLGWEAATQLSWIGLPLSVFAGQFLAGYAAARLSHSPYAGANGGLAAAGCYVVLILISRLAGSPAGVLTLVVFGAAAVLLGYGGGKLAARRHRDPPAENGGPAPAPPPGLSPERLPAPEGDRR